MAALISQVITTAQTAAVTTALQIDPYRPMSMALYAVFTYGSGGTSATAYVQTSHDGGVTWMDIANFAFTTSSAKAIYNLSASTVVATTATITDGALASNTTKDGLLGGYYRVKLTTVGTYAASTTLQIFATPTLAHFTAVS